MKEDINPKLIKNLYNKYAPNVDVESKLEYIQDKYGDDEELFVRNFYNKYDPNVDVESKLEYIKTNYPKKKSTESSQSTSKEEVTESVTKTETVPTGSSDSSSQEFEQSEIDAVADRQIRKDIVDKPSVSESNPLPLSGLMYSPVNIPPRPQFDLMAQGMWDKKYGAKETQADKNIAGLEVAKQTELQNSETPEQTQEIEQRYNELIGKEEFDQTQATAAALRLQESTRIFDETLSKEVDPTKKGKFTIEKIDVTEDGPVSILNFFSGSAYRPKFKSVKQASDSQINSSLGRYQNLAEQNVDEYFKNFKPTAEELSDIKAFQDAASKTLVNKEMTSREKYDFLNKEYKRLQDKMEIVSFDKKLQAISAIEDKSVEGKIIELNDLELKNYLLNGEGDRKLVADLYRSKKALDEFADNNSDLFKFNSDGSVKYKDGITDVEKKYIDDKLKGLLEARQASIDSSYANYKDDIAKKRKIFRDATTAMRNAKAFLSTLDKNSAEYKELSTRIANDQVKIDKLRKEIESEGTQITRILNTNPDEVIAEAKDLVNLSPSAQAAFSDKIEGLSSYEQFQRAYHQLREETNRMREEGDFSESVLGTISRGVRGILNKKEFGLNISKKEREYLANRELLNSLAPILLTNTPGISKEDSDFFDAFGAAFARSLTGGDSTVRSQTGMLQDQARGLTELGFTAEDFTEEDVLDQLSKITETDLASWEFAGDMMGSTSAIIAAMAVTKKGTKGFSKRNSPFRLAIKDYNKAMDKTATRRFVKKAIQQGADFEISGRVFNNQQEELSFEGGFLGTLGGELIQKVVGKIPVSNLVKAVASKFGSKGKQAVYAIQRAGEVISRGGGEVVEETIQELTQLYNSNLGEQGFWEAAKERFGDFDENMKFVVGSFLMGAAFGSMPGTSEVKKRRDALSPEQAAVVDKLINEVKQTQEEALKEVVDDTQPTQTSEVGVVEEVDETPAAEVTEEVVEEAPSQKKVFRAGDLTVKAEPITKFELTNRSTGHFGTGFYFFGKRADAETYAKGTGTETSSRIVSEIDLNNYNLAKATLSLHEELKRINDNEFNDRDITSFDIERIAKESGLPIKERQENPYQEFLVRNNREYEALVSKYGEAKTEEMSDKATRIDLDTKAPYEDIANDINKKLKNKENKDTRSTLVMKALGFEGVDATGTDLDNSRYGTVIYDINPQEESLTKTKETPAAEVTEEVVEETPLGGEASEGDIWLTREDIEKAKAKAEANQVVYEMNKTDKKIWSKDFEILDNRQGQEEYSLDEDGDKLDNKWLVVNKVTGEVLYATSKKDAKNIVDNAPAYADLFGDGNTVESENIITPSRAAEVTEEVVEEATVAEVTKEQQALTDEIAELENTYPSEVDTSIIIEDSELEISNVKEELKNDIAEKSEEIKKVRADKSLSKEERDERIEEIQEEKEDLREEAGMNISNYKEDIQEAKKERRAIDRKIKKLKTKLDAIPKQSTKKVDAQESTRDSKSVGEGDIKSPVAAEPKETKEADPTEVSEATETEVDVDTQDRIDSEVESLDYIMKNPDFMLSPEETTPEIQAIDKKIGQATRNKKISDEAKAEIKAKLRAERKVLLDKLNVKSKKKKNKLIKEATNVIESIQDELSEDVQVVNIDKKAKVYTVVIKENTELADKVKRMGLKDLVGKRINLAMADQLKVDEKRMGGPFFPLIEELFGKVAWASIDEAAAREIIKGAVNADYTVVYNMNPSALDSNQVTLNTLIEKVVKAENSQELFEAMMKQIKASKFGKNGVMTPVVRKIAAESNNINEFAQGFATLGVDIRAEIFNKVLPSSEVNATTEIGKLFQDMGVSKESIRGENIEQFVSELPMGAITSVLQITDKAGNPVTEDTIDEALISLEQQKNEGLPTHTNYPIYIRGRIVGIMKETVPFWNLNKKYLNDINLKVAGIIKQREKYTVTIGGKNRVVKVFNNPGGARLIELMSLKDKDKTEREIRIPASKKTKTKTLIEKELGPITNIENIDKNISSAMAKSNAMRSASMTAGTAFTATEPTAETYTEFVRKLSRSFPGVEVMTESKDFDNIIKDIRGKSKGNTVLVTKDQDIYGAVYEGKLYLNPTLANYNTPIHEFGHLWLNTAKVLRPDLYKKGLELVEEDDTYVKQVESNKDYQRVIKYMKATGSTEVEIREYILNEALATAIGDKGESFTEAVKSKFKEWINKLFELIKKLTGISKVTAEQLADMDLNDFTQAVVVDLMSETQLFKDAEVESLSNELQLMSVPANMSLESAISRARSKDISDAAILEYLKGRQVTQPATEQDVAAGRASNIGVPIKKLQFKVADIKEALEVSTGRVLEPTKLPKEFMKVEDGATQALELYDNVMKKLEDFAVQGPKGGKGKVGKRTKTDEEIQLKAQEILKAEPIYQEQFDAVQQELVVGIQKALKERLATRYMPRSIKEDIAAIKNNLRQQKIAEKDIKRKQEEVKAIIRKALPSFKGYSDADINSLILKVARTTPTNFKIKVDEVLEKIEKIRDKVKKAKINDIKKYLDKKSKTKGLDADTKAYLKQAKSTLKLILSEDIDAIINEAQYLSNISRIDNAILEGDDMSISDRDYVDKVSLFDLLADIQDKSIEQIDIILKDLKDGVKAGREKYKAANIIRAMARQEVKDRVTAQIRETNPTMFSATGTLLNKNQLAARRNDIFPSWEDKGVMGAVKNFIDGLTTENVTAMLKEYGNYIKHMTTLASALDRIVDGKTAFTDNIIKPLDRSYENEIKGKEQSLKRLDDIGKSAGYKLGYKGFMRDIHRGKVSLHSFNLKRIDNNEGYTVKFTKDELARIYALSLNDVQNDKLNKQGITPSEIQSIKDILGDKAVKFIDGVVDFLSEEYYEGVNDVYSFINNIDLSRIENYFPTKTLRKEGQESLESTNDSAVLFNGSFKEGFKVQKASAFHDRLDKTSEVDLKSESFTSALSNHIRQMEKYKAYALTVDNIDSFLKIPAVNDLTRLSRTKPALTSLLDAVISPPNSGDIGNTQKLSRWAQGVFVGIAIAGKPIQLARQAVSFVEAFPSYSFFPEGSKKAAIPGVDILGYTYDLATVLAAIPKDIAGVLKVPGVKGYITEIFENSATLRERARQNIKGDLLSLESGRDRITPIVGGQSRRAVRKKRFQVAKGIFVTGGDLLGVLGYLPNYRRDRINGMTVAEAVEKFNNYDLTQQAKRKTGKTVIQNEKNILLRMFTMFGSSIFAKLNTAMTHANNIVKSMSKGKGGKKFGRKKDWRYVFMSVAGGSMAYVAMTNLALLFGDDDDKEKFKLEMLKAAIGIKLVEQIPLVGAAVKEVQLGDMMAHYLMGKKFTKKYRPGGGIQPIVAEINRVKRDVKKSGEAFAYTKALTEIVLKTNIDPVIGLVELGTGKGTEESVYDAMGITKSYRPGEKKKYNGPDLGLDLDLNQELNLGLDLGLDMEELGLDDKDY